MSTLSQEIADIVAKANEERVKTAQNKEKGFSSSEETSTISKGISQQLKEASEKIRTGEHNVDAESVLQFMEELA